MKHSFSILFVLLFILSCHHGYDRELDSIENLIDSNPKAALDKLDSLPFDRLSSSHDKARWALLKSIALDKNYIDITCDSLIKRACAYYERNGNELDKTKAFYYHGIVLKNGNHYIDATLALEKAEKEAQEINAYHYLGLIFRAKADIYNSTGNNVAAIDCLEKSIASFESAEEEKYALYSRLALANAQINAQLFNEATITLNDLRQQNVNESFSMQIMMDDAIIAAENGQWEKSLHLFQQIPSQYFHSIDYGYYAITLFHCGYSNESDLVLEMAYQSASDNLGRASIDFMASRIKMNTNQTQEAFDLLNRATFVQDSLTRSLLTQSISCAQRDYYKKEMEIEERLRITERDRWLFAISLVFLIMSFIIMIIAKNVREKKLLLQDQMTRIAENKEHLLQLQEEHAEIIGSLFSQRLNRLDSLSTAFYDADDEKVKETLYNSFLEEVRYFRNDKKAFKSLEDDLNRYCNNIMKKLAEQVPHIKGDNRIIISMFFAGINYDTIKLLLHRNSVQSIKTLKSRLKNEIILSGAKDTDLFVKMLKYKKG